MTEEMATSPSGSGAALLACQDVLPSIIGYLDAESYKSEPFYWFGKPYRDTIKGLLSSATSCRVLSHYALDALWYKLRDIQHLLKVLPEYQRIEGKFMLCGAISTENWSRMQSYAERVRSLTTYESTTEEIHPSVWLFLTARLQGSPLLPRVRELHVHRLWIPETPFLAFLLSPTLRLFGLSFGPQGEEESRLRARHFQTSLLQLLPDMVPDLEHFIYYSSGYDPSMPVVEGCLQPLTRFKRLKSLDTPPAMKLDQHMLQVVSSIATLESLHCHVTLTGVSTLVLHSHPFLQLAKVDLEAHSDDLITFFRACRFPNMVRIRLTISKPPSVSHPRDLLVALCEHCDPTLIEYLHVHDPFQSMARPRSLMEYAEPLMSLSNMRTFYLCFGGTELPLCDDDLLRIGAAWPHLTQLTLAQVAGESSRPDVAAPSLSALVQLAQRCPALIYLALPELDPCDLPMPSTVPLLEHGLRDLKIDSVWAPGPLSSPDQVYQDMATVLDHVFPSVDLKTALLNVGRQRRNSQGWADVLRLMEGMQDARLATWDGATEPGADLHK